MPSLKAWGDSLGGITYPLLSDFYPHGQVAQLYGVLRPDGRSERAIFIVDKRGIVRYVDIHDIDDQPDNEILFAELLKIEPGAAATLEKLKPGLTAQAAPEPDSPLVLYCTPWCPACRRARAWLSDRKIPFTEIDITRDRASAQRVRGWTGGYETTPAFNVKGKVLVEFEPGRLENALREAGMF